MTQATVKQQQEQITYPNLPLAVYRELAAHLQQVEGVVTELIPQQSEQFNYAHSQVESLLIQYPSSLDVIKKHQLQIILDYYAKTHGAYGRKYLNSY